MTEIVKKIILQLLELAARRNKDWKFLIYKKTFNIIGIIETQWEYMHAWNVKNKILITWLIKQVKGRWKNYTMCHNFGYSS